MAPPSHIGQLWGVSVGPGDPELMTIKAVRLLQQTPIVAFPSGRNGQPGKAQAIIADQLQPHHIQVPLFFPYLQSRQILEAAWLSAAETIWTHLQTGHDVVFATEGDASFYSTFTYLSQTLQRQHPEAVVQTVPGVCSPLATAAVLGQPLTILEQRLMVLPALYAIADLEHALDAADVVVLMKVASVYQDVWRILAQRQLLQHSAVIVHATLPSQRVYQDLTQHANLDLPYFSLLIVNCVDRIR